MAGVVKSGGSLKNCKGGEFDNGRLRSQRPSGENRIKPPGSQVFWVEGGPDDLVEELVIRVLRDGRADLSDAVDCVNARRMRR